MSKHPMHKYLTAGVLALATLSNAIAQDQSVNAPAVKQGATAPHAAPKSKSTADSPDKNSPDKDSPDKPGKKDDKKSYRPDRLDLDTTLVTGNRELPKVLYIVPWKKAELGDLPAQPFNTLLDEILQPVDREVFRREVKYFETVSNGANQSAAAAPTPGIAAQQK